MAFVICQVVKWIVTSKWWFEKRKKEAMSDFAPQPHKIFIESSWLHVDSFILHLLLMVALRFTFSPASSSIPVSAHKYLNPNTPQCCHNNTNGGARFPEKNSEALVPPRPRRIILVRHGQSQGNVDESAYTRIADPKISLTDKGKAQSLQCGHNIRDLLLKDGHDDWKLYFYVSPYTRTLQTLQHLARPFERFRIAGLREEPRLREQDFGTIHSFQSS